MAAPCASRQGAAPNGLEVSRKVINLQLRSEVEFHLNVHLNVCILGVKDRSYKTQLTEERPRCAISGKTPQERLWGAGGM